MTLFIILAVIGLLVGLAIIAGKHKTVKAIDVAGLNFLTPVVRLCYKEEPQKQLREIGQYIVVPILAIIAFMILWFGVAEKIQTKSGKLPDPAETWSSASSVMQFHTRENDKMKAFNLSGKQAETMLVEVTARLLEIGPKEEEVNQLVTKAKTKAGEETKEKLTPIQNKYDSQSAGFKAAKAEREAKLKEQAAAIVVSDKKEKDAYVMAVREHRLLMDKEKQTLREIKNEINSIRSIKNSEVSKALAAQTAVAEERQYLSKMKDQLTKDNRAVKIGVEKTKLEKASDTLYAASADDLYKAATNVIRSEDRIQKIDASGYAKPATLPYQIARSLLCVFCGFFLGSAIAIPIGVLCGLSKTFMAAMTPCIAAFKPVSPIVWLPVALIIVGGFIPDPDKHPFTQWLWQLPILGEYKINPAFIASAITVALCSLWATMVNTAFGVASVDKDHINVARVLRLGFWSRLFKIVLPSALPLVFAGLRISLSVGWMVLIAAELLSSSEGIGKFVWDQFNNGASDSFAKMMVVVFVVGAIGLALDRMMIVFQRLVSFDGAPTAI